MKRLAHVLARLSWLRSRLRRMAPGEGVYRLRSGARVLCQSLGLGDARRVPRQLANVCDGPCWIHVPTPPGNDGALPADQAPTGLEAIVVEAERLLHEGPVVFGRHTPAQPDWNRDPLTGCSIGLRFGLFIDFRSLSGNVDVKYLWEVNRHVWWLPLAQAWALTADARYLSRLRGLLVTWLDQCPYPLGPNWSSPVEHGIRLIVWSMVWQLVGGFDSKLFDGHDGERLRSHWLDSIHQHMRFALDNESLFSSANNHLIGEAAGVFVASHTWPRWPTTQGMRSHAKATLEREVLRQFGQDGMNLEQAICYHKFALQFVVAAALCGRAHGDALSAVVIDRVGAAAVALAAVMDSTGRVPMFGDADEGEVFRLDWSGSFDHYKSILAISARLAGRQGAWSLADQLGGRHDMQSAWLAPGPIPGRGAAGSQPMPTLLPDCGIALLCDRPHEPDELRVQFDVGPLGMNGIAGHGHADALSLTLSVAGQPVLVDAGTYCYNTEPVWRRHFRSTRAHNTLQIDGQDQAAYGGAFLWLTDVSCTVEAHSDVEGQALVQACHDGYARLDDPVRHHRRVVLDRGARRVEVLDWIDSMEAHRASWHWQLPACAEVTPCAVGAAGVDHVGGLRWTVRAGAVVLDIQLDWPDDVRFDASCAAGVESPPTGWVSESFYRRRPAPVLIVECLLPPGRQVKTSFEVRRAGNPTQ